MKKEIERLLKSCKFTSEDIIAGYGGNNLYYRQDKKIHDYARSRAYNNLKRIEGFSVARLRNACNNAWGGRLNFVGNSYHLEYTAGQFYNLELPQAIDAVLQYYLDNPIKQ